MPKESAAERLIAAGEQLYAESGVGNVRLRELNALAGVRNDSAVHYHFGSQDGLLTEILRRHLDDVSARVDEYTDALCAGRDGSPDAIRDAIAALAVPFAEKLGDERGRRFIRIAAQVWGRTATWRQSSFVPSSALAMDLIRRSVRDLSPALREERMRLIPGFVLSAFAVRAQRIDHPDCDDDAFPLPLHAFVYNVVEMATAAYLAQAPAGDYWPERWPVVRTGRR